MTDNSDIEIIEQLPPEDTDVDYANAYKAATRFTDLYLDQSITFDTIFSLISPADIAALIKGGTSTPIIETKETINPIDLTKQKYERQRYGVHTDTEEEKVSIELVEGNLIQIKRETHRKKKDGSPLQEVFIQIPTEEDKYDDYTTLIMNGENMNLITDTTQGEPIIFGRELQKSLKIFLPEISPPEHHQPLN